MLRPGSEELWVGGGSQLRSDSARSPSSMLAGEDQRRLDSRNRRACRRPEGLAERRAGRWIMLGTSVARGWERRSWRSASMCREARPGPTRRDGRRPPHRQPRRLFRRRQHRYADGHILTLRSRFIRDGILDLFERRNSGRSVESVTSAAASPVRIDVAAWMRQMSDKAARGHTRRWDSARSPRST
jgi:hypothetical protein